MYKQVHLLHFLPASRGSLCLSLAHRLFHSLHMKPHLHFVSFVSGSARWSQAMILKICMYVHARPTSLLLHMYCKHHCCCGDPLYLLTLHDCIDYTLNLAYSPYSQPILLYSLPVNPNTSTLPGLQAHDKPKKGVKSVSNRCPEQYVGAPCFSFTWQQA